MAAQEDKVNDIHSQASWRKLARILLSDWRCPCPDAGSSLVDWLISNNFAANRLEAVTLASVLMEENFLRPVGARSMGAIRSGDLAEQFLDDSTALYTFVSYGTYSSCHQGRGKEGGTEWRPQWVGEKLWVGGTDSLPGGVGFSMQEFPFSLWEHHSLQLGHFVTES